MTTNKRIIIDRMETKSKYTNAQKWALAETIALGLVIAFCVGLVLLLNALIPPNW